MTFTANSPFRELGDLPKDTLRAEMARKQSPLLPELDAIYGAVQGMSALYLAQAMHESELGTTGIATTGTFNCLGNMVPGSDHVPMRFQSWAEGAAWWKARILNPAGPYAKARTVAEYIHIYAPSFDGNNEGEYVAVILRYANLGGGQPQPAPQPAPTPGPVPRFATAVPGLPGGPLLTSYPIKLNLIPAGNTYQRPGTKAKSPRRSVQHGTGNPTNASAQREAAYFVGGAEGRQASVHATIDDTEVWVIVPLDEVTWQAADGAGPGNMCGLSSELCEATAIWSDPARRANAIAIAADFMGRCSARLGIAIPEQHYTFNAGSADRHDCPDKLRHVTIGGRLAWDLYAAQWQAAKADEQRRMQGGAPTPQPTPTPQPPADPNSYPPGVERALAARWFGKVVKDGGTWAFDPTGPVSRLWLARGGETGEWPRLVDRQVVDGRVYFVFEGGFTVWTPSAGAAVRVLKVGDTAGAKG